MLRRLVLLSPILLASGCTWPVRQVTNDVVRAMADHPFDVAPASEAETPRPPAASTPTSASKPDSKSNQAAPEVTTDVRATAWMEAQGEPLGKLDLNIPPQVPGSEAPRVELPTEKAALERALTQVYPELPPLPAAPVPQQGPGGKPYTLSDLQRLAAANSPALRQAAADVEAARGILIQAQTYQNPTFFYLMDPSNNNDVAGVQGAAISQPIVTGGKMKLGVAAAQKDLDNAQLALKRARSDLSTAVRQAYFMVLVDVETLVITRALAQFTDDIYRLQTGLLRGAQAAPYEPASLRAQAYATRLAYQQAIASYIYDWKQLVATTGIVQLPLSHLAGRVDRLIPYYDYDQVLASALQNHTDVLSARNTLQKAQYNLKLAKVTPLVPDVNVYLSVERDFADAPYGTYSQMGFSMPLSVWDQNKGNIIAAEATLLRAGEESHRVAMDLTNRLAAAYGNYKNNLYAMEFYRRNILPDLTRYYRGIFARRQVDPGAAFNDLVTAQQTLSSNVTLYINVLGALWSSAVTVADFLQTDDLFQLSQPRGLPELPDFDRLPRWLCDHPALAESCGVAAGTSHPADPPPPTAARANEPPAPPATMSNLFGAQRDPVLEPPRPPTANPAVAK